MNLAFLSFFAASRTRSSSLDTLPRPCVRHVIRWFAFPWLTPFSPSLPPTASRPCSGTSSILRSHPTSSSRASSACGFRPFRCGPQFHLLRATRGSPSSRVQSVLACMGSSTTPGRTDARALAPARVAFRFGSHRRHPGLLVFEAHYPARLSPYQRFDCSFAGCTRMTRGHRGSRLLRCEALSSSTRYRFCWRTIRTPQDRLFLLAFPVARGSHFDGATSVRTPVMDRTAAPPRSPALAAVVL